MEQSNELAVSSQDEISAEYANNIAIEPTVWDVKTIFGEYSDRSKSVDWHTSVSMPWATAKLLCYYLQLNIALFELYNGKVRIPFEALPAPPAPLPGDRQSDPTAQVVFQILQEHWRSFIDSLGEKKPGADLTPPSP